MQVYGVNNNEAYFFFGGRAQSSAQVLLFVILRAREKIILTTSISSRDTYEKFVFALVYYTCNNRRGYSRMSRGEHRECRHLAAPCLMYIGIPVSYT